MRQFFIILFMFYIFLFADDGITEKNQTTSDTLSELKSVDSLTMKELQKFYIGFIGYGNEMRIVTLDIKELDSLDNQINFTYTLNSKDNRKDGVGKIFLNKSIIQFENLNDGKIYQDNDGKVVFESTKQDSLNYWKIKEK